MAKEIIKKEEVKVEEPKANIKKYKWNDMPKNGKIAFGTRGMAVIKNGVAEMDVEVFKKLTKEEIEAMKIVEV